jgi:DNA polymerase elongation subunit (family B)
MDKELMGGHASDPIPDMYRWVVSFDLNSLYPHLIMQYNISPETFFHRYEGMPSIDDLLNEKEYQCFTELSYAANGCTFRKDEQGFLPR